MAFCQAILLACLLLPPTLATTFHRIETIPFDREVEKGLVSEEEEKGGEPDADAGFFLPYRKFTDIPGCTFLLIHLIGSLQESLREMLPRLLDGFQGKVAGHMRRQRPERNT